AGRQHERVRLRMWQTEAAEDMAELVVDRVARRADREAREPGAIERRGTRLEIARRLRDDRQRRAERADAFFRDERNERIAVVRIERLAAVRDRIHPTRR